MLENFFEIFKTNGSYNVLDIILRLLLSLILSAVISLFYKIIKPREAQRSMTSSLIIISVTISAAIMLIGDNLARSFGLVGAVSIIRFRSAVKSPMDMAFIFLTIVLGMACGLGLYSIALIFFIIIILVIMVSWRTGLINSNPGFFLTVRIPQSDNNKQKIEAFIKEITNYHRFIALGFKGKYEIWKYFIRLSLEDLDTIHSQINRFNSQKDISVKIESS